MGEIASPLCESRNCGGKHCTRPQTEAFIATKDESLVFDHWPADRGPKLIPLQRRLLKGGRSLAEDVTDRIQLCIAQEVIGSSMEHVRSGAHDRVDDCSSNPTILSAEVARYDFEFGDRVRRGLRDLVREALIAGRIGIVIQAIHKEVVVGAPHPVRVERALPWRVRL